MLCLYIVARKNQLDKCFGVIEDFFDAIEFQSFSEGKFQEIFYQNRYSWDVPNNKSIKHLLAYLINRNVLFENVFSDASNENKLIYSWKTKDELTVISGLKSGSYFTHYSALYLHQLSLQIPKIVYLNFEHTSTRASSEGAFLTQASIDKAFTGSQRKSSLSYSYFDKKIIITNGMYTNKLGLIKRKNSEQCFEYTDIERTLIDISVRPVYAGGVFEVIEAYRLAKSKLNVAKMADYLKELDFIYPYNQVIGFYLEKAGYNENDMAYFQKKIVFNFYLTYDIRNKEFSEKWKLFYPKGI